MITKFIYPRRDATNEGRERLGEIEIPPYAEQVRICPGWVMDGSVYDPWVPDGPVESESFFRYLEADVVSGQLGLLNWTYNFYPTGGWSNKGLLTFPTWGRTAITARSKEWIPIPVTARSLSIELGIPAIFSAMSDTQPEMVAAVTFFYLRTKTITIEYKGIG